MTSIKLKVNKKHPKGNLTKSEIGTGYVYKEGQSPFWFKKHQREFYWDPVWLDAEEYQITKKDRL